MHNLFDLTDIATSGIPDMANVAEASGHTTADLASLTGEGSGETSQPDVPTMGCGNGVVPAADIPAEIRDVLAGYPLERMSSASGYGLWDVLRRAAELSYVKGLDPGFGPVS